MNLTYEILGESNKTILDDIHNDENVKKYLHVANEYYNYLLRDNNAVYKLVKLNLDYVGGLHFEVHHDYATFSIEILSDYQRQGIAYRIIDDLKNNYFNLDIKYYEVFIEDNNMKSRLLFEKSDFRFVGYENKLRKYVYEV